MTSSRRRSPAAETLDDESPSAAPGRRRRWCLAQASTAQRGSLLPLVMALIVGVAAGFGWGYWTAFRTHRAARSDRRRRRRSAPARQRAVGARRGARGDWRAQSAVASGRLRSEPSRRRAPPAPAAPQRRDAAGRRGVEPHADAARPPRDTVDATRRAGARRWPRARPHAAGVARHAVARRPRDRRARRVQARRAARRAERGAADGDRRGAAGRQRAATAGGDDRRAGDRIAPVRRHRVRRRPAGREPRRCRCPTRHRARTASGWRWRGSAPG